MIRGKVVAGKKIGRKLGFPTANIALSGAEYATQGVYAARIYLTDSEFKGMAFVGRDSGGNDILEVNIFGLEADIYGQEIGVELVKYIRPVEKFATLEELKAQLECDRVNVVKYFNSI